MPPGEFRLLSKAVPFRCISPSPQFRKYRTVLPYQADHDPSNNFRHAYGLLLKPFRDLQSKQRFLKLAMRRGEVPRERGEGSFPLPQAGKCGPDCMERASLPRVVATESQIIDRP